MGVIYDLDNLGNQDGGSLLNDIWRIRLTADTTSYTGSVLHWILVNDPPVCQLLAKTKQKFPQSRTDLPRMFWNTEPVPFSRKVRNPDIMVANWLLAINNDLVTFY